MNRDNKSVESVLEQCHKALSHFFELQWEQEKTAQRFIVFQEKAIHFGDMFSGEFSIATDPSWSLQEALEAQPSESNQPYPSSQLPAVKMPDFEQTEAPAASGADISSGFTEPNSVGATQLQARAASTAEEVAGQLPDGKEFEKTLLELVSEKTGFPPEMLDLDANMEADLGIDSIKKVEIFSLIREKYAFLQDLDEEQLIEELAALNTLGSIISWYDAQLDLYSKHPSEETPSDEVSNAEPESPVEETIANEESEIDDLVSDPIRRMVPRPVAASIERGGETLNVPAGRAILLFEKKPALGSLIEKSLSHLDDNPVLHVVPGSETRTLGERSFQVCLSSTDSIGELRDWVNRQARGVGAVINLTALNSASQGEKLLNPYVAGQLDTSESSSKEEAERPVGCECVDDAKDWFLLLKIFVADLNKSAQQGVSWIVNFSFLDGHFGLKKEKAFALGQAGSIGLTKAVAREFPSIKVKCIDVDPDAAPIYLMSRLKKEFATFDDALEIGLDGKHRWKIETAALDDEVQTNSGDAIELGPESVVLVTGGAYGIVAEVTKELASRYRPNIILVGRSSLPEEESADIRNLQTESELRQFYIEKMRRENISITPAGVLERVSGILKARQIRENLEILRKNANSVEYHSIDIRDEEKFEKLLDQLYEKWGKISGVIHGAGIIDDKRIESKTIESFARVYDTKVKPAMTLKKKLRPKDLRFLALFSSVAARFGNVGQTDYCAGNEVLNKLADLLDTAWKDTRVVALNWGPWDSGMVTGELVNLLSSKGFSFIPVKAGVEMFFKELNRTSSNESEVVITRRLAGMS